jgi:hypothetical protein
MTYFVIDTESDGPVPHLYSMVSFGAVVLDQNLDRTFYGRLHPISDQWLPEALAVAGHTREETLTFPEPELVMPKFAAWVTKHTKPGTKAQFVSDNNGFDFGLMSYYLWRYTGENVFGHSSRNLNDLYRGMKHDMRSSFNHLRRTVHDHHPVNDAIGNAEAFLAMREKGLQFNL